MFGPWKSYCKSGAAVLKLFRFLEQYLVGKTLNSADTVQGAVQVLLSEVSFCNIVFPQIGHLSFLSSLAQITPDQPPAAASAAYRLSLASTLLYKSILAALPSIDPR